MPPKKKPRFPPGFLAPGIDVGSSSFGSFPAAPSWGFHLSQIASPSCASTATSATDAIEQSAVTSESAHITSWPSTLQRVDPAVAYRSDAPLVKPYARADRQRAHEVASSSSLLSDAVSSLRHDAVANSARKSRQSLLATWVSLHSACCPDTPTFPLLPESIEKVAAALKAGGYRSVRNYLSRAKDEHLAHGHHWDDLLARSSRLAVRACERGQGPPSRQVPFDLGLAFEKSSSSLEPLVSGGPLGFKNLVVIGCFHMLREIELSTSLARSLFVDLDRMEETLHLPTSKTDHLALGVWRSWGCVCAGLPSPAPCPYHAAISQRRLLLDRFAVEGELPVDLPLFPSCSGHTTSKAAVVASLRAWLSASGLSLDNLPTGGHSFRVTGAQLLAKAGIDTDTIMIAARWTSSAVLKYIREAPLKALTQRYASQLATGVRSNLPLDVISSLEARLVAIEAHVVAGSTITSSATGSRCSTATQVDASIVVNNASGVVHRMSSSELDEPGLWRTLCGWRFAHSSHSRHLVPPCGAKRCVRCFEPLPRSPHSTSSSSSS